MVPIAMQIKFYYNVYIYKRKTLIHINYPDKIFRRERWFLLPWNSQTVQPSDRLASLGIMWAKFKAPLRSISNIMFYKLHSIMSSLINMYVPPSQEKPLNRSTSFYHAFLLLICMVLWVKKNLTRYDRRSEHKKCKYL